MIMDKQNLFSDDQAVTVSAASTNHIDLGAFGTPVNGNALSRDIGPGNPIPLTVQVTTAFATCDSVKVGIQIDSDPAFGTVATLLESEVILTATLVAGYKFNLDFIPQHATGRYVRLYYTVAGSTATAGKITAGVSAGHQTNL